ncbi:unnamed protein product [Closterium sp. Yama58-4]|nr:unnamed protein product [Closterium sp. Yama58-4]
MRRLAEVEVATRVHVRLVGFDGDHDDNSNLRVSPEEMTKFLNTLKPDTVFRAIHGESHALAVRQRVAFSVSRAPRRLASAISADIFRFVGRVSGVLVASGALTHIPHSRAQVLVLTCTRTHTLTSHAPRRLASAISAGKFRFAGRMRLSLSHALTLTCTHTHKH